MRDEQRLTHHLSRSRFRRQGAADRLSKRMEEPTVDTLMERAVGEEPTATRAGTTFPPCTVVMTEQTILAARRLYETGPRSGSGR